MIPFSDHELPPLPKELASVYEIVSCLKYTDKSGTYLLHEKPSGSAYLLKTAVPSVYANMLSNEKNLLEEIHQTAETAYSSSFPTPVYLAVHSDVTYYIRSYIPGRTLEEHLRDQLQKTGDRTFHSAWIRYFTDTPSSLYASHEPAPYPPRHQASKCRCRYKRRMSFY